MVLDVLGWGKYSPKNMNRNGSPESFDIFISVEQANKMNLANYKDVKGFLDRKNRLRTKVIELWTDGINYYDEKGKQINQEV